MQSRRLQKCLPYKCVCGSWHVWIMACVDRRMCGSWRVWIVACVKPRMCESLRVWITACVWIIARVCIMCVENPKEVSMTDTGILLFFIICCTVYHMWKMRQGKNKCSWFIVGEKRRCEVSCVYVYCKHHRMKVRAGITEPTPCFRCGAVITEPTPCFRCVGLEEELLFIYVKNVDPI